MVSVLQTLLSSALAQSWTIPAAGLAVAGLAYVLGRRYLVSRPRTGEAPVDATFLKGVLTERRAAPRRKQGSSVLVDLADGTDAPVASGWVQDRSIGGLGILAEQAFAVGATLQVRPRTGPETTPWTAIVVRSCRPNAGLYELGCQFRHTPPWSVLLLFG